MTTIEAMACGTPVVVSNLTAVPEVVKDEGGIILPDLSIESIVDGINRVIKKDYPYTRYNAKLYEENNQFKQYLELFKKWYAILIVRINASNTIFISVAEVNLYYDISSIFSSVSYYDRVSNP